MDFRKEKPAHLRVISASLSQETDPVPTENPAISSQSRPVQMGRQSNVAPRLELLNPLPAETAPQANGQWRSWSLWLSLMKPITWVPVVWSFWCGAVGAGGLVLSPEAVLKLLGGLLLSGPLLCGMSQAINDYFDRDVDAVNEPWRVVPSGRLTLRQIYQLIAGLGFAGLLVAYWLGPVVTGLAFLGIFMAHNYSAPPLRFKRLTWVGPFSSSVSYILIPWLAAASVFGGITWRAVLIAGVYSLGGIGIMILNDFKSIWGDFQLKLPSVPVVFGTRKAAMIACAIMDSAQFLITLILLLEGRYVAAGVLVLLLVPQLLLQRRFIEKPLARAIWYNARGQNFLVLGMLVASWLAL